MKVIGITGGVGSGKSTILDEISKLYNCRVLFSDLAAKELQDKNRPCYEPLIRLLGEDVLDEDENIDKKKMSNKIFADKSLVKKVNDIIHPAVKEYILSEIDKEKKEDNIDYFFIEAALLIECGYKEIVDEMWYIFVNDDERRKRLKASRGYTDLKIDQILANQLSDEEFRVNSDFIVDNSYSIEESIKQITERLV